MTNNDLIEAFEEFVDDEMNETVLLAVMNQARQDLEIELKLQCSKKLDTSQSVASGNTYLTNYTLHASALAPVSSVIYVGDEPFTGIPFEHRERYKNITGHWYVDLANSRFHLTGSPTAGLTITFPYIGKGTDIAADDNTSLHWPTGHLLVPMRAAQIWYGADADKQNNFIAEWGGFYEQTKRSLINVDAAWKHASIGGATPYGEMSQEGAYKINDLP